MQIVIGYILGSVVTLYLVYRAAKKKKAEAVKLVSNAQSLNKEITKEGDEDEL